MAYRKCEHGKRKNHCIRCGGASICPHQTVRSMCKKCKQLALEGIVLCFHNRERSSCPDCLLRAQAPRMPWSGREQKRAPPKQCAHGSTKTHCKVLLSSGLYCGSSICEHETVRGRCTLYNSVGERCGGSLVCEHGRYRYQCPLCLDAKIVLMIEAQNKDR